MTPYQDQNNKEQAHSCKSAAGESMTSEQYEQHNEVAFRGWDTA